MERTTVVAAAATAKEESSAEETAGAETSEETVAVEISETAEAETLETEAATSAETAVETGNTETIAATGSTETIAVNAATDGEEAAIAKAETTAVVRNAITAKEEITIIIETRTAEDGIGSSCTRSSPPTSRPPSFSSFASSSAVYFDWSFVNSSYIFRCAIEWFWLLSVAVKPREKSARHCFKRIL